MGVEGWGWWTAASTGMLPDRADSLNTNPYSRFDIHSNLYYHHYAQREILKYTTSSDLYRLKLTVVHVETVSSNLRTIEVIK